MKSLTLAFLLAAILPVQAQYGNPSKTIRLFNNQTNETIGTMTMSGNTAYLRDKDGNHYATIVGNADGTKTMYDPNGKVIEAQSHNLPKLPD
jgi:hypothetical protein